MLLTREAQLEPRQTSTIFIDKHYRSKYASALVTSSGNQGDGLPGIYKGILQIVEIHD